MPTDSTADSAGADGSPAPPGGGTSGTLRETIRRSLKLSVLEGLFHSLMVGAGETFLVPFAVYLLASNLQIGLLANLPMFLGALPLLWTDRAVALLGRRRRLAVTGALVQALFWIPIAATVVAGPGRVWWLLGFACFYWCAGMIFQPAWADWMADLVPPPERGGFFGRRNRLVQAAAFAGLAGGGLLLRAAGADPLPAFLVLFAVAGTSRLVSALLLSRQYEPPPAPRAERPTVGLLKFLRTMPERNFGGLALYLCLVNFALHLASPFYIPYMLRDLGCSYAMMTFLVGISALMKYLSFPLWGRACDRYGARKVLAAAGSLMPVAAIMWGLSARIPVLAAVQVFSGFTWAAYDIASYNFLLSAVSPRNRVAFLGYFAVLNAFAALAGGLCGWGLTRIDTGAPSHYPFVFLVSGLLRWLPAAALLGRLREVRVVEKVSYRDLILRVFTIRPTHGITVRPVAMPQEGGRGKEGAGAPEPGGERA